MGTPSCPQAYTPPPGEQRGPMRVSRWIHAGIGVAAAASVCAPAAHAAPPSWSSVKVQNISPGVPWTEPRITTGPDGTLWVVTNGEGPSESPGAGEEPGTEENTAP